MPFEARPLPQMIEVGGEMVVGPFCRHCGYPFTLHGNGLLCPAHPNFIMGPSCDCHEIRTVRVKRGRKFVDERRIVLRSRR